MKSGFLYRGLFVKLSLFLLLLTLTASPFTSSAQKIVQKNALFPYPQQVSWGKESFSFNRETQIIYTDDDAKKVA